MPAGCSSPAGVAYDGKYFYLGRRISTTNIVINKDASLIRTFTVTSTNQVPAMFDGLHLWYHSYISSPKSTTFHTYDRYGNEINSAIYNVAVNTDQFTSDGKDLMIV